MVLTMERAGIITELLNADTERAEKLVSLDPSEAVKQINALGYDFSAEELNEYGEALRTAAARESGELELDALDDVAGGVIGSIIIGVCALIASRVW